MSESTMKEICVGTRVIDIEDKDPNVGVVVAKPPEQTIADWEFQTDDRTTTTADTNPDYPTETQLVIVAFETALDKYWPKWDEAAPDDLFDGVREHDVYHYGFPESRLTLTEQSGSNEAESENTIEQEIEAPPDEFGPIMERLEQNEFTVGYDAGEQVLRVEKFEVEHTIDHDGTVHGESGIKGRVETIVNRFL